MIGAGTVINPLLKVVTTVAILAAVYFFIVKPTLDTTEDITNRAFEGSSGISEQIREDISRSLRSAPGSQSIDYDVPAAAKQAQKLGDCIAAAQADVARIERCVARFGG